MDQDRGVVTRSHLRTGVGLIKNSANVTHNGGVDTETKGLPPSLLEGAWHPTYREHCYAGQNLYRLHQKSHHVPYYIDILQNCLGMFNLGIISTFFTLRSYFINLE